jgi:periplasmic copper chaperone A
VHRPRPVIAAFVSALVLLVVAAAPASAHVDLDPTEALAGSTTTLTFSFLHGKDGTATTGLSVQMPPGAEVLDTPEVEGWQVEVEDVDPPVVTWSGGSVPDGTPAAFPVEVRLPVEAGTVLFPTVQETEAGDLSWISVEEGENEDMSPAPRVLLLEDPDATQAPTTTLGAIDGGSAEDAEDEQDAGAEDADDAEDAEGAGDGGPAPGAATTGPGTTVQAEDQGEGGSLAPWVIGGGLVALVLVVGGGLLLRQRAGA